MARTTIMPMATATMAARRMKEPGTWSVRWSRWRFRPSLIGAITFQRLLFGGGFGELHIRERRHTK